MAVPTTTSASGTSTVPQTRERGASGPRHTPSADNIIARLLGIIVFLAGVALLVYVFQTANALFNVPPPQIAPTPAAATNASSAATSSAALQIGQSLTDYLKKLLTLLLMCVAGSLISSKGVQLYFSAGRAHAAVAVPPHTDAH